jgi:hypothetical protein
MNVCISEQIILDVESKSKIQPVFIEKDWWVVRIMKAAEFFSLDGIHFVLGGGTSLSKGHKLIERFSEDLDFKIINAGSIKKSKRREIRHAFIDEIAKIEGFSVENVLTRNEGKFCGFDVVYPNILDIPSFLRRSILVELFFDEDDIEIEKKPIKSLVAEYVNCNDACEAQLDCVYPFYTAVGKFSGLMWRLFDEKDQIDYTLLRHMHDLYALAEYCKDDENFKKEVLRIFETEDCKRIDEKIDFSDVVRYTCAKLTNEPVYRKEYQKYVEAMCYSVDDKRISYDSALSHLQKIAEYFL